MHPLLRAAWAITAAFLLFPALATAQAFDWHKSSGVDGNVFGVAFDAKGGKWVANGGLSHFDGTAWTNYDKINTNGGLVEDGVTAVMVDRAGNVWAGMEAAVSRFDGRQWTRYTSQSTGGGLPLGQVNGISQDRKGNIWFSIEREGSGKEGGVSRFDGTTWTHWGPTGKPLPCSTFGAHGVAFDGNDTPWAALGNCVASFDGTRWTEYDSAATGGALQGAFSITADRQGGIWFGGIAVVTRHANGRWTRSGPYGTDITRRANDNDQNAGLIRSGGDPRHPHFDRPMTVDGDGVLWAAATPTDNPNSLPGLFRYDANSWRRYQPDESWRHIISVTTDPRGKVWVGIDGLYEFDGAIRTTYNGETTLAGPPRSISALGMDGEGGIWAGGYGAASVFNGRQWQLDVGRNLPQDMSVEHITGRGNTTWLSLWDDIKKTGAIARRTGSSWTVFKPADLGVPLGRVNGLATDARGKLWAATDKGALMFDGARWSAFTVQNTGGGIPSNQVRDVAVDARDHVWFSSSPVSVFGGNDGGVSRFDGSNWTTFSAASTGGGLATNNITSLAIDSKGRVWAWVGASLVLRNLGGLAVYDGTRWQTMTAAANQPYLENPPRSITADNKGGIWLATEKGAIHYDGAGKWQAPTRENTGNAIQGVDVLGIVVEKSDNVWLSVKGGGLNVLKAPGTTSQSTARPLPLRTESPTPRFADTPETAAAARAAADAKAAEEKAKADRAAAFSRSSPAELQATFCETFSNLKSREALNELLVMYQQAPQTLEAFMQAPACKLANADGVRAPAMHLMLEHPSRMTPFIFTLFSYYNSRRKDATLFTKAANAKNTAGETLLDYSEYLIKKGDFEASDLRRMVNYACSKGAVYSKVNKTCAAD